MLGALDTIRMPLILTWPGGLEGLRVRGPEHDLVLGYTGENWGVPRPGSTWHVCASRVRASLEPIGVR